MISILLALCFATSIFPPQQKWQDPEVHVQVDRNKIHEGESFRLILSSPHLSGEQPDTSPLEQDFFVYGTGFQTQTSIIQGKRTQSVQWVITLQPKHAGKIKIPSLRVGDATSPPLEVEVLSEKDWGSAKAGAGRPVFVEVEVENLHPYVQSKVLVTAKVWMDDSIRGGSLTDPELEGALLERVGEDVSYTGRRGNKAYQVIERRYAVFPQTSGKVTIPPLVFDGQRAVSQHQRRRSPFDDPFFGPSPFDSLFERTTPIRAQSEAIDLEVQPKPDEAHSDWWLPAKKVEIVERWEPDPPEFRVAEPVTRNIFLRAVGLAAEQMPELELPELQSCKTYPGKVQHQTDSRQGEVISIVLQPIVLVPTQAGSLTLPAIEVSWWDTEADEMRIASLPEQTIEVLPGSGDPVTEEKAENQPPLNPEDASSSKADGNLPPVAEENPESWLSQYAYQLGSGIFFGLISFWLWQRRRGRGQGNAEPKLDQAPDSPAAPTISLPAAEKQLRQACQSGDPAHIEQAILQLGGVQYPQTPPRNSVAWAKQLDCPQLVSLCEKLQEARFAPNPTQGWSGVELWQSYQQAKKQSPAANMPSPLPQLYPQHSS